MMDYAEARPNIVSGDVILFRGRGPMAWLIRILTHSEFDHAAVVWYVAGRVLIVESRMIGGVHISPLSTRLVDHATWIQSGIFLDEIRLARAIRDLGLPYSYANDLRALEGKVAVPGAFECAQLVAEVLDLPGDHGWTPEGIYQFFAGHPAVSITTA